MSMVLSIYSVKGFREVTLPERNQAELDILIEKEIFGLDRDVNFHLVLEEDRWHLYGDSLKLRRTRDKETVKEPFAGAEVQDGTRLVLETPAEAHLTVICFEQKNPFTVYRKYSVANLSEVRIGRDGDNDFIYTNEFVSGHHCVISFENGRASLRDLSRNGTYVNFRRVYGNTILQYGDSIRIMRLNIICLGSMIAVDDCDNLQVRLQQMTGAEIQALAAPPGEAGSLKVLYHRSPRNMKKLHTEPYEIEPPPSPPDEKDPPLIMSVGPALTMAIPMVLGTAISALGSGTGNNVFLYMGLVTAISSALIGAIWAVVNVRYTAKMRRQEENRRFERYGEYLIRMRDRIEKDWHENADALKERYLSASAACGLSAASPLLWNRNSSHEDFLAVRLGMGDVPFQAPIVVPKEKFSLVDDSLADKPQVICDSFSMLKDVPVTVDLRQNRLLGIAGGGNRKAAAAEAKAMIAQIAAADCYTDVKIAVVFNGADDTERDTWDFAMWLPHVWSSDKKIRFFADSRSGMSEVFSYLTQVLRQRSEDTDYRNSGKEPMPRYILFISDPRLLDGEPVCRYIFDRERDLGLSTVLVAASAEDLPNECECIIEISDAWSGIYDTRSGRDAGTEVAFDTVTDESLWKLSHALCRVEVVDADEEGELPGTLTFFDMYGISRPEDFKSADRWKRSDTGASMKAMMGLKSGNRPCWLDIHENAHGPHGLVAGTTGSGKSETLQTWMLSLAANYSPEEIGFLIIDYKGGGLGNLFETLPHTVGVISNLSGNRIPRAMAAIEAEKTRRERIFADCGVTKISAYTALYKAGDATEPLPHLLIIVDEFAELKTNEPDFMKELNSIAAVGRSLGVHLILSTQKPGGTVDENIWANSKFHLCLRVQDKKDSVDMLHRPEAAYLTQAGRCYLQVGSDEVFELFQSGWSGAAYDEDLAGTSLLIAEMLSPTGKVDLAGNHAKVKRKEEQRRRWAAQLIQVLREAENETGIYVQDRGFTFADSGEFKDSFYRGLNKVQPSIERSQITDLRIGDFCSVYGELAGKVPEEELPDQTVRTAARTNRRLPEARSRTQLEVTVEYLKRVAEESGTPKVRSLWLPELPHVLYLEDMEAYRRTAFDGSSWREKPRRYQLGCVIGMADDPENQAQMPISLDFTTGGHHMVIGAVATGKSTFLQSAVWSLASAYSPDLLNIYCLDFSTHMLSVFSELSHVGGVLDENMLDTDRFDKFFTMIGSILDERKAMLSGTSFEDWCNHHGWTIPAILIVIDSYGSFHGKTGEDYEDILMRIAKEGIGCGVYLLVSAGGISMAELPTRVAENFATGIALEMNDPYSYADVMRVTRMSVLPEAKVKGRGLIAAGERILEFQTALAARSESGPERNALLAEAVEEMNAAWNGPAARKIPEIPESPRREEFIRMQEYRDAMENPRLLPLGYDYETAGVWSIDLLRSCSWLIMGSRQSGKSTAMENLILSCIDRGDQVLILEMGTARLQSLAEQFGLWRYTDGQGLFNAVQWVDTRVRERASIKVQCLNSRATDEEMFEAALANQRIDIFISGLQAVLEEFARPESPAYSAANNFSMLCEKARGYNLFFFTEVGDRELAEVQGYRAFQFLASSLAGIRFGGRFSEQRVLPFENIPIDAQSRSMDRGVGVLPSEQRSDPLVRVVVPQI